MKSWVTQVYWVDIIENIQRGTMFLLIDIKNVTFKHLILQHSVNTEPL